ncbi:hypothetical protein [Aeromicrobium chenweiae]|uniref:hypothetical protein n=1 Tax=Aeromicrobium chenweiae TaxID=2079793 RepID=UPI001092A080|nr:hypothetical protein [Aeromicrobium chenweiae]TGN32506.1 hypothetical protein E4L97_07205 [Aeromicrobium chenweiae]
MRTPARVLTVALSFAVMFVAGTAAAMADAPTGGAWPDGEKKSDLDLLLLFGGGTLVLFVVVALFGLLTARNNYVPPAPSTELATTSDNAPVQH